MAKNRDWLTKFPLEPREAERSLRLPDSFRGRALNLLRFGIAPRNLVKWVAKVKGWPTEVALRKTLRLLVRLNQAYGVGIRLNEAGKLQLYG
jgi:hypothetical protein